MDKYGEKIRLGMALSQDMNLGNEVTDIRAASAEYFRVFDRNQQILRKLEARRMSFCDLQPSTRLVEEVRSAGLYVCPICYTVDDPDLWGNGRDYRPACHCED